MNYSKQLTNAILAKTPISFYNQSSHESPSVFCRQRGRERDGIVTFQLAPGRSLRIDKRGRADMHGDTGPWTKFSIVEPAEGMIPSMMLYAAQSGRWLTIDEQGQFASSKEPVVLHLNTAPLAPVQQPHSNPTIAPSSHIDQSVLSTEQLAAFEMDGFIIVRDAIPQPLLRDCLRSINRQLGVSATDPTNLQLPSRLASQVLNSSPRFWSAINLLLGEGNIKPRPEGGGGGPQVALRFPENRARPVNSSQYHVDGMNAEGCGFTLLCGVALSDQAVQDKGNLHVYPGSHLNKALRQYYIDHLGEPDAASRPDKPYVGEPVQVLLSPGDVVIAHQMLAHAVGQNAGHDIRYQLYYRISHAARRKREAVDSVKQGIVDNPWIEYNDSAIFKKSRLM